MANNLFDKPVFIPKIQSGNVMKSGINFQYSIVDAQYVERYPDIFESVKEISENIIVDPVTYLFDFPIASSKVNFKKLPYSDVLIERLYEDKYRLENLVWKSIEYQIGKNSAILTAPYLYAEGFTGGNFNNSLTMLSETLYYCRDEKNHTPVFATLCISDAILRTTRSIDQLVAYYSDPEIVKYLSGYIIMISGDVDRKADQNILRGLAYLVAKLSSEKEVIVKQVGGFGEALLAIGASAVISGLAGGENFNIAYLKSTEGFGRDHTQWTYVPEVYDYVNIAELAAKVDIGCDCPSCEKKIGKINTSACEKKLHFLYRKWDAINAIATVSKSKRIDLVLSNYELARKTVNKYRARGVDLSVGHLDRWISVLNEAKEWDLGKQDDKLDKILEALDSAKM
ncbi:MAG: hypothetical protein ABH837_01915 [bacterium]